MVHKIDILQTLVMHIRNLSMLRAASSGGSTSEHLYDFVGQLQPLEH
jgi:hypothetical protein